MLLLPALWWPTALLALALFGDAAMSIRPMKFIQVCLDGVRFPRQWWWTVVVIKLLATVGLVVGLTIPGVGFAANIGVVVYFLVAVYAHIRAGFLKQEFWLNCLGMLILSLVVLLVSYVI